MFGDTRTKPMEILLVEDGLTDAQITIHALRRSGVHHRLTLVRAMGEANQFLRREGIFARAPKPDLILLDVNLPDGSGLELLESVRRSTESKEFSNTTTVVLTASEDEQTRKRCEDLGVTDYITKPVNEEEFLRVVRDRKRIMVHSTPTLAQT